MQTARGFPVGTAMTFDHFDQEPNYRDYIVNHFNWAVHENEANAIQTRLDKVGQFGLPVWVTALDVLQADENVRADVLELVLRSVYSHPSVEGILFWGFWAGAHWQGPNAAPGRYGLELECRRPAMS